MPKSAKQKEKLLYIIDFLKKNSNENNPVTTPQIIEYLNANGIKAERKSIYDDMETLLDFGFDVIKSEGKRGGYFLGERDFELAEVKVLVDLVLSSKFITEKKSRELVKKLEKQVSHYDATKLHRQVIVADRNKASNENIYYSVDIIHEAMAENLKVRYQYFEWDENKKQRIRKNGDFYEVSPWLLTWEDENYYLMAFDDEAGIMKYYRVDKMLKIEKTSLPRMGQEEFEKIDVAAFSKKTFGMFAGEERTVRLLAEKSMTGVLVDRFGQNAAIRVFDEDHVLLRAEVAVSPHFFGWLAGLAGKIKIEGPEDIKESYRNYINELLENI